MFVLALLLAAPPDPAFRAEAAAALRRAVAFYRGSVARHGGYPYYTAADLGRRWGEGELPADTVVVQPPGTPTVGLACLAAHAATGDPLHLDAAREAAEALVAGQLQSGGWTQVIHFGPAAKAGKYRTRPGGSWNASSLDDGQTQAALRLLIAADRALGGKHPGIADATRYGLDALLKAQFPSGGFPQVWTGPVAPRPILKASYPGDDWRTAARVKNYWDQYTLNDNLAGTVAEVLVAAHAAYGDDRYKAALARLGDFLIAAQMPDPQPAWCQQYGPAMTPIWARKFEPPAVTGWESQDVMETLVRIARRTGDAKYLEPVPRALAYLRKSRLADGRLARFYELRTNRPLYMDADYRLTYDDAAAPAHYGWKQPARLDAIERAYKAAQAGADVPRERVDPEAAARRAVKELDAEGRWVSVFAGERLTGQPKFAAGFRYLSSGVFAANMEAIAAYLAALSR